ncbi:MAG: tRNA (adenosine(37)-N6)-dimethylallyltransferase MiaA [Bacteroidetes bacterium]|nr:MAG: tRNA (adenosine(37)-N6)-dimethylallyltransferase MiaA [Bacteroidota bacterium]
MKKFNLVTVLGPTATGKTSFATNLASKINGEIISADSRQVYKSMDIGTGKDIDDYKLNDKVIPYHLIDIVDAGYSYNVFEYQKDFLKAYNDIISRNKFPILCGGTGMYIEAVLKGYKLIKVPVNEGLRQELELMSKDELIKIFKQFKTPHNVSDLNSKKRLIRAIEIENYYSENPEIDTSYPDINALIFGIKYEREKVKQRITQRLKSRLEEGMIEEVKNLLDKGIPSDQLIYYGLEYKFVTNYILGNLSYDEMFDKLNIAIHQFSKRQMTWFRRMERNGFKINWIDGNLSINNKIEEALKIIDFL